jgi:vacuolar-type H+-ATPase subunit D/Vma8
MGAYYPAEATCRLPDDLPVAEIAGTAAMVHTVRAHRDALERAVQHAATNRAVREVDRELLATRRRLRTLQRQWIPALLAALNSVDIELEERERDDVVHARWAHTKGLSR